MILTNMPCRRQYSADSRRLVPMLEYEDNTTDRAGHLPRGSGNSDCTKVGMKRRQASKIAEILGRVAEIEPASQAWKASALPLSYTRMAVWAHCHQKGHRIGRASCRDRVGQYV